MTVWLFRGVSDMPAGGTCVNRQQMRCSRGKNGCGTRFSVSLNKGQVYKPIRCPSCGSACVVNVTKQRKAERAKRKTCRCPNYPFPHTAGTLRMCVEHPDFDKPVTYEQEQEYKRVIETPRSSNG